MSIIIPCVCSVVLETAFEKLWYFIVSYSKWKQQVVVLELIFDLEKEISNNQKPDNKNCSILMYYFYPLFIKTKTAFCSEHESFTESSIQIDTNILHEYTSILCRRCLLFHHAANQRSGEPMVFSVHLPLA